MKIAIIGSGIAGNVAAYHLHREHDITVYEAADHIGGHTHTHSISLDEEHHQIDTGFIVFNDWTYPNFVSLLNELGVPSQDSHMSFSVRNERTDIEYNGTSLNTLYTQRLNLLSPSFHRMVRDILRFNREAPKLIESHGPELTLGDYLESGCYSQQFIEDYLIPMGAAIWSTDPDLMLRFPARYFVQFFKNHGMLSVDQRPQWRVISGGSASYVEKLAAPFRHRIRLNSPVEIVRRSQHSVIIKARNTEPERYDQVFFACHSDQALKLLADASTLEREVLGAICYQENEVVLHTDSSMLPRRQLAWAAWNYNISAAQIGTVQRVALTYNMNILQGLQSRHTFCVTLNRTNEIDERCIIKRLTYHHPLYTPAGVAVQQRQHEINGVNRSYFCGAYWGFGFHEDGVVSALNALQHFSAQPVLGF